MLIAVMHSIANNRGFGQLSAESCPRYLHSCSRGLLPSLPRSLRCCRSFLREIGAEPACVRLFADSGWLAASKPASSARGCLPAGLALGSTQNACLTAQLAAQVIGTFRILRGFAVLLAHPRAQETPSCFYLVGRFCCVRYSIGFGRLVRSESFATLVRQLPDRTSRIFLPT
jgi:hypothetical protein